MAKIKAFSKLVREATEKETKEFTKSEVSRLVAEGKTAYEGGKKVYRQGSKKENIAFKSIEDRAQITAIKNANLPENNTRERFANGTKFRGSAEKIAKDPEMKKKLGAGRRSNNIKHGDALLSDGRTAQRHGVSSRPTNRTLTTPKISTQSTNTSYMKDNFKSNEKFFPEGSKKQKVKNIKSEGYSIGSGNKFIPTSSSADISYKNVNNSQVNKSVDQKSFNMKGKEGMTDKVFNQKNIKTAVGAGVTGAIVFNMFGNGGKQSNSELYGQQQRY